MSQQLVKKLIKIDIVSDTVCPWCYIGKKHLEKAMNASKNKYDFEFKWHPFLLNPNAPKEGIDKVQYYKEKFGESNLTPIINRTAKVFEDLGINFKLGGLTGSTMDSHRLIEFAAQQGADIQDKLVEELFINYFTQEKYIGDRQVLLSAAEKVGVQGAKEYLDDPNAGVKEMQEQLQKYASGVRGVPHFQINGRYQLSGAQPPDTFLEAFRKAASDEEGET